MCWCTEPRRSCRCRALWSALRQARCSSPDCTELRAILEAEDQPGGLCRSERVDGHVLDQQWRQLRTRHPEVYDFIFSHIARSEFHEFGRVSKVLVEGTYVDYPLEYNLWQLPQEKCDAYLSALLGAADSSGEAPSNYAEWTYRRLGKLISEQYMLPYNSKIWGFRPPISTSIGCTKYRPSTSAQSSRRVGRDVRRKA